MSYIGPLLRKKSVFNWIPVGHTLSGEGRYCWVCPIGEYLLEYVETDWKNDTPIMSHLVYKWEAKDEVYILVETKIKQTPYANARASVELEEWYFKNVMSENHLVEVNNGPKG